MKAVGDKIIFRYFENNLTEGGVYLLHDVGAKDTTIIGEVISVGSLVKHVNVGDSIILPKLMKSVLDVEEGLYTTLESQVLGILDN